MAESNSDVFVMPDEPTINLDLFVIDAWRMDPEKHTLLYGNELRAGMRVLTEPSILRRPTLEQLKSISDDDRRYDRRRWEESARWCEVTKLRRDGELVTFIGKYDDGELIKRTMNESYAWYVEIDSIPEDDVPLDLDSSISLEDQAYALNKALTYFAHESGIPTSRVKRVVGMYVREKQSNKTD